MASYELTLGLFKKGHSMAEIAFIRKFAFSTIETHLQIAIEKKLIGIEQLLPKEKIDLIKNVISGYSKSLSEIKPLLPEDVAYGEIRWVLAAMGKIAPKKPKPQIIKAINTYIGNCCMRKCFNHENVRQECFKKFDEFAHAFGEKDITVSEFFKMMNSGAITICKLSQGKRKRIIFWKEFEEMNDNSIDLWDSP